MLKQAWMPYELQMPFSNLKARSKFQIKVQACRIKEIKSPANHDRSYSQSSVWA